MKTTSLMLNNKKRLGLMAALLLLFFSLLICTASAESSLSSLVAFQKEAERMGFERMEFQGVLIVPVEGPTRYYGADDAPPADEYTKFFRGDFEGRLFFIPEEKTEVMEVQHLDGRWRCYGTDGVEALNIDEATYAEAKKADEDLTACFSNLKNINVEMEIYSTDHEGRYPDSMSLLTPNYFRDLPECPAAEKDTYSETYESFHDPEGRDVRGVTLSDYYEVRCDGGHHTDVGVPAGYPQINAVEGLTVK